MIWREAFLLLMMMAYASTACASPSFYTQRLQSIAQVVGIQFPDVLQPEKEYAGRWTYKQRPLRVRTNAFGDVSHIGYGLFDERIYKSCAYKAALDFVERYALELTLDMDKELRERLRITDKVTYVEGSPSMLAGISPVTPVTIEQRERRMFRIRWTLDSEKSLTLSFPADYQLITGANAIELERMFERDVQRVVPISEKDLLVNWQNVPVISESAEAHAKDKDSDSLCIVNKGNYLNDQIRSDILLRQHEGKRTPLFTPRLPLPSIRNLLLTGLSPAIVPMNLTIDCYGNQKRNVEKVNLQQFVGLCRMEGCELYVGIKSRTETEITAVLFALNPAMAYNHVLSVKVPLRILQEEGVPISGTLYAYIPLQNISEKFFTQDLKN